VGGHLLPTGKCSRSWRCIDESCSQTFDYVTSLGTSQVFDYNSPTVVDDIVGALRNRPLAAPWHSA